MIRSIQDTCAFCAEINQIPNSCNYFLQYMGKQLNQTSRIVMETDNFVVFPTVGCFVEGYLLIVSKEHYSSFACLPATMLEEQTTLIAAVKTRLQDVYGKQVICFEHGSAFCDVSMGGCVDHAHMHLLPYDCSLTEEILPYALKYRQIHSFSELWPLGNNNMPYLYWQDIDGLMYVVDDGFVPSQFFRRIVANHYNMPESWDWRQFPYVDKMIKTIDVFCHQTEVINNDTE